VGKEEEERKEKVEGKGEKEERGDSSAGSFAGIGGQEINDVISTSNHWILINKQKP